jgi:hypothetical protein
MESELRVKLAVYEHFAAAGSRPSLADVGTRAPSGVAE